MIKCHDKEVLVMSREMMTQSEIKRLRELQAKEQRIRRQEKAFWNEVEERLPEIMERFNLTRRTRSVSIESPDNIKSL